MHASALSFSDEKNQIKANYSLVWGIPEHELNIYTTLSKGVWFAHLKQAKESKLTKRTAVVSKHGIAPGVALRNLHIASAIATQGHLQNSDTDGVGSVRIDQPVALRGDDKKDRIYHGNGDESGDEESDDESRTETERHTSEGNFQAPEINQGRKLLHTTRGVPGMGPFLSDLNPQPSVPVRIRIFFADHDTFEIVQRVYLTTQQVVLAAIRHCSTLIDDDSRLHGSLKSVSAGGTTLLVQGGISNLAAMIGALPAKGGAPILEVEVTKAPGV